MTRKAHTQCESLDFVEAVHRRRIYPVMYCHMKISGRLDIVCLKNAITLSSRYVPEVLYAFDFKHGRFIEQGFTAGDVFFAGPWDLGEKPQLQIIITRNARHDAVVIGMSHILSDGAGFLQYLYLLASLYNGERPSSRLHNNRSIGSVLSGIQVQPLPRQAKRGNGVAAAPLRPAGNGKQHFCLCSKITPGDFAAIHAKARQNNVTLNDVFMAAYARVVSRRQSICKVAIPCPADLRRFRPKPEHLTVANMTGIYRSVSIEINPRQSLAATAKQAGAEMAFQKSRHLCFSGILLLDAAFRKAPHFIVKQAIRQSYRASPVSYTNLGVIDCEKLLFHGCDIEDCYLTGTYRLPPDFQLSVSTFKNVCTLNCMLAGDASDEKIGQEILEQVKNELNLTM